MKIKKSWFRHLLLTAIHQATKGKATADIVMVVGELEREVTKLKAKLAERERANV